MFFIRLKIQLFAVFYFLQMISIPAQCTFSGLAPNYCVYSPTVLLSSNLSGGIFSGPGISGSTFDPAVAGPGTHSITYGVCTGAYSVTAGTYSPIGISTGTGTGGAGGGGGEFGSPVLLNDDQVTTNPLSIGFNFNFFCNTYSAFYIGSNGFITFSTAQSQGCCSAQQLPNATSPNNLITLTWADWDPGVGGSITYTTVGVAPNRKLLVTFNNVPHYFTTGTLTAQLQLHETTNVIEVHTTLMNIPNNVQFSTMGIENSSGTAAYAVPGRNAVATWSASTEMYKYVPIPGCASSQTTYVSPSAVAINGVAEVCNGGSVSLVATGNTSYTWSTGANSASVALSPTQTVTYSVSATNALGCRANSAVTVTVLNTPPVVTAISSAVNGICPNSTLMLSGVGASSYSWTGGITNAAPFSLLTSTPFTVTGTNACGTSTAALSVSVHALPTLSVTASSASLCSGSSLTLTAAGNANSYTWSGGSMGIVNGVGFSPAVTAVYTVTGTGALNCTNSASISVAVVATPLIPPTASSTIICTGSSSTLTALGASNYTWYPSLLNTSTITIAPLSNTTYTVIRSNANCISTQTISVRVNPLPAILAIVTPTSICASNPATLNVAGAQTYTWVSSGIPVSTFTGSARVIYPAASVIYSVAASDGTCINITTVSILVNPNPVISIVPSATSVCSGQTVNLIAGGGTNYTWTSSQGLLYTASISDTPTVTAYYSITADNIFNCTSSAFQVIIVNPYPQINLSTNKPLVCAGGPSTITATGATTYTWINGVLTSTNSVNTNSTTVYSVTGSFSTGCSSSKTLQISVYEPVINLVNSAGVCKNGTVIVSASGASSYTWQGMNFHFPTISLSPSVATVYTLTASSSSNGVLCLGSNTLIVNIYADPAVTASSGRTVICRGEKLIFSASGAASYLWNNSMPGATVQVYPSALSVYTVVGTDTNGCVNTATVTFKFSGCAGIAIAGNSSFQEHSLLIYPNPNNGSFRIEAAPDLELKLVDALGRTIREYQPSAAGDRVITVNALAAGVYFITAESSKARITRKIIVEN